MQRLVVYADYVCPFCYLAEIGVGRLGRDGIVQTDGAAFELYPAGAPLPSPDAEWMRRGWTRQVEPLAAELGAEMRYPQRMTRTRKAHEAAAYARSVGRWAEMHSALYRAYWRDGQDIGRIDVLAQIGAGIGLDATSVRIALDIDQWTEQIETEQRRGVELRLAAVPAYVLESADGAPLQAPVSIRFGLMRYEELKAWVETQS